MDIVSVTRLFVCIHYAVVSCWPVAQLLFASVTCSFAQELRRQVLQVLPRHLIVGLGAQGARAGLPPGVLRLRRLRPPALHRRAVRSARGPRALQAALSRDPRRRIYLV